MVLPPDDGLGTLRSDARSYDDVPDGLVQRVVITRHKISAGWLLLIHGPGKRIPRSDPPCRLRVAVLLVTLAGNTAQCAPTLDAASATTARAETTNTVASTSRSDLRWHVELKRQFTERGTPEESSRTTLRLEATPKGFVSLVRLDLPFVDKKNGDASTPGLGDVKLKLAARPIRMGPTGLTPFFETTFPTADPESLGNGKYQISPGAELKVPLWARREGDGPATWTIGLKPQVQQVISVAGDEARKDLNYTKLELALQAGWRQKLTLSVTPKIVFDWEPGGSSGAVLELKPGWNISRHWRTELTLGQALWGRGEPTIYGKKVELALRFNF